ncbi:subtilisin-like protease sbt5.4 [Phtheirospermum japonicum]|uniref:Subtilisin-like protease sbt5.4 n=1 Tax=Phtheirospermum japonicum TaxID=374723 RepID=A0A830CHB7_9LAMI|nr:subtilisin-like protease sbt5.4 [Phtheirospermum japonicum]
MGSMCYLYTQVDQHTRTCSSLLLLLDRFMLWRRGSLWYALLGIKAFLPGQLKMLPHGS